MINIEWINGTPYVEENGEYRKATPHEMEMEGYHD